MKKYFILPLVIWFLGGCTEDFLTVTPEGTVFSSTYFQNEQQVQQALLATYDALGHQKGVGLAWSPYLVLSEVLSDDAYAGGQDAGDGAEEFEFDQFNISTGNEIAHSIWKRNYTGVYRANFTIEKANALENISEENRQRIIAEAKFLRAYFYFEQVRFFENIVMPLAPESPSEAVARTQEDPAVVYNQIASDLVDAINALPEAQTERFRATKWAAQAMLARVYLFEDGVYGNGLNANGTAIDQNYILTQLEDIINNGGYSLVPDFADVFAGDNEFNEESIFEIAYDGEPVQGDWGSEQYVEGNLAAQMMGPRVEGASNVFYRGWSFAIPTHKLYQDMQGDPRLPATIFTENAILTLSPTATLNTGAYQHTGYYNAKYTTRLADRGTMGTPELHNMLNYRAIRYAEVLLMAAEVGQNVNYMNEVRARVGLAPVGTYSDDALFQERRMELAGEGHRYWDVLRRGQNTASQELTINGIIGPDYTGEPGIYDVSYRPATRGFLPVPQTEIDLSNNVLIQNEGY